MTITIRPAVRTDIAALITVDPVALTDIDRRSGVGLALIEHCKTAMAGEPKLWSSTNRSNAPMRALLAKSGFVESGVIENLDEGDPEMIFLLRRASASP